MKTIIIVQARMKSTRLPGKVMKPVLGKSLLEYQIERLRRVRLADDVVIATTVNVEDKPIVECCEKLAVKFFRGDEQDVLSRYFGAATQNAADIVVRVTSDCPLIDPEVIDKVIGYFIEHKGNVDYVSNIQTRTYPRGMDTEVFSFTVLAEAHRQASKKAEREHVTPFIHMNPQRYRLTNVVYHENQSQHRWTVDTPEDFLLIERIISALYPQNPEFNLEDCLALLKKHSDWKKINAHIEQKIYEV